jgi:pimeloyl-ACP methyl ester carboxylesterase
MKPFRLSGCGVLTVLLCLSWSGAASAAVHVYLLRGIFNVSVGLDALAAKLGRIGIAASVYGHDNADTVTALAAQGYRNGTARPIILIGHSLGAGAVVEVARQLNASGIPVGLLITLDPVGANPVPGNVGRAVNLYVSGEQGVQVQADAGFRGSLSNMDFRSEGMDHMTIQSADSIHRRLIGYVGAAAGGGGRVASRSAHHAGGPRFHRIELRDRPSPTPKQNHATALVGRRCTWPDLASAWIPGRLEKSPVEST